MKVKEMCDYVKIYFGSDECEISSHVGDIDLDELEAYLSADYTDDWEEFQFDYVWSGQDIKIYGCDERGRLDISKFLCTVKNLT